MSPAEMVKQRLDSFYPIHLRVDELAQMTGLNDAQVVEALAQLQAEGQVEPVHWRATREAAP